MSDGWGVGGWGLREQKSDSGWLDTPVISWEGEVRRGLAQVSGWVDSRQHADAHRPEQIYFKIDCTNKHRYRAHLTTFITVREESHQRGRGWEKQQKSHIGTYCTAIFDTWSLSLRFCAFACSCKKKLYWRDHNINIFGGFLSPKIIIFTPIHLPVHVQPDKIVCR